MARILVFKIRPSQEILKIRDGTPLEMPSQEILKIRDGTPLEAEGILTYRKKPSKLITLALFEQIRYPYTPLEAEGILIDVPSNVVQKKRVARILVFKIRPSQEILKIRDGTPLELDWPSQEILKIRDEILKIRDEILKIHDEPSQEILKIRDGTPLEKSSQEILKIRDEILKIRDVFKIRPSQEILKIRDEILKIRDEILKIRDGTPLEWPSQEILKIRDVAWILVFKIRPSQEILKIRDGTPLEAEGILTYRKKPSQEILKIRDGTPLEAEGILTYRKVLETARPSQEILKIRDGTPLEIQKKRVARILVFKIRPSQEILKIRDGTPLEAEGILTYRKSPRNFSVWHFSSKLDVPSNVVQKKRVSRILVFKIRPSQEILKIRDGTPLEAEGILTYRKSGHLKKFKKFVMVPLWRRKEFWHAEKSPRNCSVWHFSSKLDVPSNVVQKKRVARILVFKIRPSQEILKIRDGTPLEAEGILTYRKSPRNCSVWHFSSKLDVPSNVVQNKRVARIRVFKIRPSQEILKIRDGTPLETEGILTYKKKALETDRFGTYLGS
ncbi:hypothetical protein OROHE_011724 [Orobanche hederae]